MKHNLKLLFVLLGIAIAFATCSKGGVEPDNPQPPQPPQPAVSITIPATENVTPSFSDDGGASTVSFTVNASWSAKVVEAAATWCTVSPASGASGTHTITINCTKNDTPDSRSATVQLTAGTVTKTIKVSQKQKNALTVTSNRFEIPAEGGNIDIEAKANVELSYTIAESAKGWISYVETKALKTSHLVFKVAANEGTAAREAKITVSGGGISEEINVVQAAKVPAEFKISQTEFKVGAEKSTFEITITSSIGYQVKPEVDWIKETSKSGSNGVYTHTFEVAENTSADARKGVIVVCNDEQVCIPVTVEQAAKVPAEFKISQTEFKVGADKSTFEITITSSIGYQVKPDVDWIKETSKNGSNGVYTHTFEVAENTSADARKGVIVVCNDEQVCIPVTVEQAGAEPQEDTSWVSKEFFHKSLGMRFTADWCGYCPMMATALDDAKAQLSGNLEVLSLHASGGLYSAASDALAQQYKVQGFPTGYVDGRVQISNYSQTSVTTSKIVEAVKETEAKFETVTGASWESSVSGNKINLDLMVYFKKAGYYKVTALLVEDNIVAYQAGASNSYNHKDVVRGAFANAEGAPMTITQDGSKRKYTYSMDIPSGCKKENLRIVVYIQERQSNSLYYVNNAASAAVGKQQPLLVKINNTGDVEGIVPGDKITF